MIGKGLRILSGSLFLLLALVFLSVPYAETSGCVDAIACATLLPTPQPLKMAPLFAEVPVDLSELSQPPVQLTEGGCCSYAGWSSDSEWVLYLDGKADTRPTGLYSLPITGGTPSRLTNRYGIFTKDWTLVAYPEAGQVYIERWADGSRWTIPSNGRAIAFSGDMSQVAWEYGSQSIQSPERRQIQIWLSTLRGEQARELVTVHGGDFVGWVAGSNSILASGRLSPPDPAGIWRIDTETGAGRLLFEVEDPKNILISPSGEWIAFVIAFESDPSRNGIWVMKTDGGFIDRLPVFGAYRWRSEGQLLVMPLVLDTPNPSLYQLDLEHGHAWTLLDPAIVQLDIANNDWSVSPDGRWLLFLSAEDRNLWVFELPELPVSP
ncbi:MAG: hypothetical protein E4G99_09425 [Anaerolineales bacterium]|nr:MAG: hypothetical protein E4G99_09425 [Anaerolineales bacterium]